MPAPFVPTGSDLKSTNQPAALLELGFLLQADELALANTTTPPNNVTITIDSEAQTATLAATLPFDYAFDTSGKPVISATNYLSAGGAFVPGTSDLDSTTKPAALLEMGLKLAATEAAVPTTPPNNVAFSADFETKTATLAATLPITIAVDGTGKAVVTGVDYIP